MRARKKRMLLRKKLRNKLKGPARKVGRKRRKSKNINIVRMKVQKITQTKNRNRTKKILRKKKMKNQKKQRQTPSREQQAKVSQFR